MTKIRKTVLNDILKPEKKSIISGPFGSNISSKYFVSSGIPVIRGNNLTLSSEIKFKDKGFVFVTPDKAQELNCFAHKGELIFTAAGTIGQVGLIPEEANYNNYVISNKQIRATLDTSKIDILYAYYWFSSPWIRKYLTRNNKGSTVPLLTLNEIKSLPISFPIDLKLQQQIVSALELLNKKISNNNAISKELESMAKTIYDYWFLQFEFPDKDGKPYKSNGGKMVWNDQLKQEIPEGWEVKYLSDIESNIVTGKTPSTKDKTNFGKDVPFICIGDIRNHSFINSTAISLSEKGANSQKKKFISSGSLCVSCIATPGLIGFTTKDSQTNQQINTIVFNNIKNKYFLYYALFEYFNSNKNVKTGNTFSNMNKEEFSKIKIIYNKKLVDEYFNTVNSYFEKIKLCEFENEQLQSLRDFLLPMLMNGQVIIED